MAQVISDVGGLIMIVIGIAAIGWLVNCASACERQRAESKVTCFEKTKAAECWKVTP